jgi:hypothetical protein
VTCPECQGTGHIGTGATAICSNCKGWGRIPADTNKCSCKTAELDGMPLIDPACPIHNKAATNKQESER